MVPSTRKLIIALTAVAAVAWLAVPADAQRGGGHQGGGRPSGGSAARSAPSHAAAPMHQSAPVQQSAPPQRYAQAQYPPQSAAQAQAQARGVVGARVAPLGQSNVYSAGRVYGQSGFVAGRVSRRPLFNQPYHSFRPRFNLGFGIFLGYPVAYPYAYYDPYGFYNYGVGFGPGYGMYDSYSPGYSNYTSGYGSSYNTSNSQIGGLSFDIDPVDAAVFIDGKYVGVAADFSSAQMPLTMAAGRHHIDLRAQGFMTVSFDITVVAGQVIPYEGSMPIIR